MSGLAVAGEIYVDHASVAIVPLDVPDTPEDPFDDIDVMLSTIEVTHAN